jgi:hypothetical protein
MSCLFVKRTPDNFVGQEVSDKKDVLKQLTVRISQVKL